jgi:hypothetical protein
VLVGGFLGVIVALACIGTAVMLYPVVKRQNGAPTSSIHRSHWWSAGCTNDGVRATTAISALARAKQTTPPSAHAAAGGLSRPPWPTTRLRVRSVSCPGWLTRMVAMTCGYCP